MAYIVGIDLVLPKKMYLSRKADFSDSRFLSYSMEISLWNIVYRHSLYVTPFAFNGPRLLLSVTIAENDEITFFNRTFQSSYQRDKTVVVQFPFAT